MPVQRHDFDTTGWTITEDGETWTMQEPFGAFTWYAVNDQPADKALYDFTLTVPAPWTGVANGELLEVSDEDGAARRPRWHLAEPAASYLVTTAFGDFDHDPRRVRERGADHLLDAARSDPEPIGALEVTPEAMAWLEDLLGPYPFDTFGTLVVDSESGMETQTMVTLGGTAYTLSPEVIVHELAHQWYGDQVTPTDWRDVWMNEGMAMYLQGMWEAEQRGRLGRARTWTRWAADETTAPGPGRPAGGVLPRLVRQLERLLRTRADVPGAAGDGRRRGVLRHGPRLARGQRQRAAPAASSSSRTWRRAPARS